VLENSTLEMAPLSVLNAMTPVTKKLNASLLALKNDSNLQHLTNANSFADTLLAHSQQIPSVVNPQKSEELAKELSAYKEVVKLHTDQLRHNFQKEVENLSNESKLAKEELAKALTAIHELDAENKAVRETIQKLSSEFSSQFQNSEQERSADYKNSKNKLEKAIEQYTATSQKSLDSNFTLALQKSTETISILDQLKNDAAEVYGVTIGTLQAGAYSSYANEEKKTANRFRMIAGTIMLISATIMLAPEIHTFSVSETYTFDYMRALGRVPLSLIILVPAFYFARESSRHRANEFQNRRRQHIITTIDPYLKLMDEKKAEEVKVEVAKSIFSENQIPEKDSGETGNLISQLANLVKQIQK
jgi:hypothetical protein